MVNALLTFRLRRVRVSVAELMGLVALASLACAWPVLRIPASSVILTIFLLRLGLSFIQLLVVTAVIGVALGLAIPPILPC